MKQTTNKITELTNPEIIGRNLPELERLISNEKSISIAEFRRFGYLQELNRLFLHPLGLSLVVKISEEGDEALEYIADFRDEGVCFDEELMKTEEFQTRINNVQTEFEKRSDV